MLGRPPSHGWRVLGEGGEEAGGHRVRLSGDTGLVACCPPLPATHSPRACRGLAWGPSVPQ